MLLGDVGGISTGRGMSAPCKQAVPGVSERLSLQNCISQAPFTPPLFAHHREEDSSADHNASRNSAESDKGCLYYMFCGCLCPSLCGTDTHLITNTFRTTMRKVRLCLCAGVYGGGRRLGGSGRQGGSCPVLRTFCARVLSCPPLTYFPSADDL